jgi:hypothetical protein
VGQCITSSPIAMLSANTSSAAECAALCYKYRYVTTTVTAACGNYTYTTNNTVAPYFTCLMHPPIDVPVIINSTDCTSGPPCAGPCTNMTDCNGGTCVSPSALQRPSPVPQVRCAVQAVSHECSAPHEPQQRQIACELRVN